jgi:hypothetical protein
LRRDIGIWAGIYGIAHTIIGLNVHMHGHMSRYFIPWTRSLDTSSKAFILANWLGLVAAILLLVLVSISNDYALRTLGTRRWKLIQQSTYVVVIAAVAHGAGYQIIEGRKWLLSGISRPSRAMRADSPVRGSAPPPQTESLATRVSALTSDEILWDNSREHRASYRYGTQLFPHSAHALVTASELTFIVCRQHHFPTALEQLHELAS